MFYTVDEKTYLRKILDHGPDAIISNWPSRLRQIIEGPPYKYYLRMATPNDRLK